MERHGHLQLEAELRTQLLKMSAATIDRQLGSVREGAYGGRKKRTALNRIRKLVAVRRFADWMEGRPGFLEVDLVTHCGERAIGSFAMLIETAMSLASDRLLDESLDSL